MNQHRGYQPNFLGTQDLEVPLPKILESLKDIPAKLKDNPQEYLLSYENYSVVQHRLRGFPLFSACNISGENFISIPRDEVGDHWKKDLRIAKNEQWGQELYDAKKSDFDRGHMTKREDVQWGENKDEAIDAARTTFFFTNAAPQHGRLNRGIWKSLENYILKTETVKNNLRICLFTGPVLADDDPVFVTTVNDQTVKIPVLFWKVIYFAKEDQKLYRVAFLTNQRQILEKKGIVKRVVRTRLSSRSRRFLNFKNAEIYQVNIKTIEILTGLRFSSADEPYSDDRPTRLIVKEVNVRKSAQGPPRSYVDDFPEIMVKNLSL